MRASCRLVVEEAAFFPPQSAALDLALWDLKGKALDVPIYDLLGGMNRNYLECYATGGGDQTQGMHSYRYDPLTNHWSSGVVADLPESRTAPASAVTRGLWVLAGGAVGLRRLEKFY